MQGIALMQVLTLPTKLGIASSLPILPQKPNYTKKEVSDRLIWVKLVRGESLGGWE
jgi:hypothetical protein